MQVQAVLEVSHMYYIDCVSWNYTVERCYVITFYGGHII